MKKKTTIKAKPDKGKKAPAKAVKTVKAAKVVKTVKAAKPAKSVKAVKAAKAVKVTKTAKSIKVNNKFNKIMVQHMFRLQGNYKAPDGRVFRIVLSEVYNLRCFEVVNGNLVGPMVKIHPTSDFAKSLVEVTN
jgi:hypothetical protein